MIIILDTNHLSEPAKNTLLETIRLAKGAHMTDIDMRINGENRRFEADWIKYMDVRRTSGTDVDAHKFLPLRWFDLFHGKGRCRARLLPKSFHPVHCWMTARPLMHYKYYDGMAVLAHRLATPCQGESPK